MPEGVWPGREAVPVGKPEAPRAIRATGRIGIGCCLKGGIVLRDLYQNGLPAFLLLPLPEPSRLPKPSRC